MVSICSLIAPNTGMRCRLVPGGFGRFLNYRGPCARRDGGKHMFLALNQSRGVVTGDFKAVPVRNGVGRAGFHAVTTENAAVVVDVIDFGVTLAPADANGV